MAKRDSGMLDSYEAVQAYKRASERKRSASDDVAKVRASPKAPGKAVSPKPPDEAPTSAPPTAKAPLAKAGHSAIPVKRLIVCYHCGYSHTATGALRVPYCPKCRALLDANDIVIDEPREGDALTIGDVAITGGAAFTDGAKVYGKIVKIGADVSNLAALIAAEALILMSGAKLGGVKIENRGGRTLVPPGENVKMPDGISCTEIDVAGALDADVRAERGAILRSGAVFHGTYSGPSLIVEDGAAISAGMRIEP